MRYLVGCTCLFLLVIECTLSRNNVTAAGVGGNTTVGYGNGSLTTGLRVSTAQPRNVSPPMNGTGNSSSNSTNGNGSGTMTTTARTTTTTCRVNNPNPGNANPTTTRTTHNASGTIINVTSGPAYQPSVLPHLTHGRPGATQPYKGGTASLLAFPSAVLGALLFVALCNH